MPVTTLEEVVQLADKAAQQRFFENGSVEDIMYLLFEEPDDHLGMLIPDDPSESFRDSPEQVRDAMEKLQPAAVVHTTQLVHVPTGKDVLITYGVDFGPIEHVVSWEIVRGPEGSSLARLKIRFAAGSNMGSWLRSLMAETRR